jgi:hypothetical protein
MNEERRRIRVEDLGCKSLVLNMVAAGPSETVLVLMDGGRSIVAEEDGVYTGFYSANADNRFLRNVGMNLPLYTASNPIRPQS